MTLTPAQFVREFQRRAGLVEDGIPGRDTLRALDEVYPPKAHALGDPAAFFSAVRRITGPLDQVQVDTINRILAGAAHWPLGWLAYGLATAWHEARLKPIEEWGRGKGRPYGQPGNTEDVQLMTIDEMIEVTIGKEGGYSDHPADRGGKTMWGITEHVARRNGYTGRMRDLPREKAVAIYRQEYAIRPGFAAVAQIMPKVGEELFDTGVNMGPAVPSLWLQEWLNAFNNGGRLYPDIAEDADIGPATLAALRAFKVKRGYEAETVLVRALNCSQGERYKVLSRNRAANEAFTWGWMRTRVA